MTLRHCIASDVNYNGKYEYYIPEQPMLDFITINVYRRGKFAIALTADVSDVAEFIFFTPSPTYDD